jgi:hypothetical protein
MPCMCGDLLCPSCGSLQGTPQCANCGDLYISPWCDCEDGDCQHSTTCSSECYLELTENSGRGRDEEWETLQVLDDQLMDCPSTGGPHEWAGDEDNCTVCRNCGAYLNGY